MHAGFQSLFSFLFLVKIIVFYIIYYAFLAGFFTLMLLVFFQTLNDREPTWQVDKSLIGTNPGMGFRPRPEERNMESTLIWFRAGTENGNWEQWVQRLGEFVKVSVPSAAKIIFQNALFNTLMVMLNVKCHFRLNLF